MGSMGTVGSVDVKVQGSTRDVTASIDALGESLAATAARAKEAGDTAAASVERLSKANARARFDAMMTADTTQKALTKGTAAYSRALAAFQREEAARRVAMGLTLDATREAARADELAAMKAEMLAGANEKLGLSTNPVIASFQRMSLSVRESLDGVGEKIAATAERAELSADGIGAAFSGMGELMGLGLAGGFLAHTLDNIAELNVELGDLNEKTGAAVQTLAGLRLIAQSKGLDFTTISMGLTRLGKAIYEAKQGMTEDREAFATLGISMQEVNTLSVEQMFFRISKAIAENKSLVISDGAALELFGRGGKELVPMLRDFGGGLEEAAKQQGALTGITERSVRDSQRWLRATADLSAEFHAGMIPVLEDLVSMLPYVETGFHLLQVGVEETLGTTVHYGLSAINILRGIGAVADDIAHRNFSAIPGDWNEMLERDKKQWADHAKFMHDDAVAAGVAWNSRGGPLLQHSFEGPDQNRPGDVDGGLLKKAKQELANMEQKHKLTHKQLVDFWQTQLKAAKPGGTDYDSINLILGNLAQKGAGGGRGHVAKAEDPNAGFQSIVDRANKEIIAAQRKQQASSASVTQSLNESWVAAQHRDAEAARQMLSAAQRAFEAATRQQRAAEQLEEQRIRLEEASGKLSRLEAARQLQSLHDSNYQQWMDAAGDFSRQFPNIAVPGAAEAMRQFGLSAQSDQTRIDTAALSGSVREAMDIYVQQAQDVAKQITDILTGAFDSVNSSFSQSLMGHAYNGREYRRGIEQALGNTARGIGGQLLNAGFHQIEGGILSKFGFGPKGKPDGTSANPLFVRLANGDEAFNNAGGSGLLSHLQALGSSTSMLATSSGGGDLGVIPLIASVASIAGFADGGTIPSNSWSIVGERGMELLPPVGHPREVIPNSKLGGFGGRNGGDMHINVDARGAHDPAAVEAAAHRAVMAAAPHIAAAAFHAVREDKLRKPSMAR